MNSTLLVRALGIAAVAACTAALVDQPAFAKKKPVAAESASAAPSTQATAPETTPVAEAVEENLEDLPNPDKFCKSDIETHCPKVSFGNNQIASCLRNQRDAVSAPCKKALYDYLKKRFDRACKTDVKKYCQKESTQQGGLNPCLQKHAEVLSDSCQEMMGLKKPTAAPAATPTPAK